MKTIPISYKAEKPQRRAFWGEEIKGGEQILPAGTQLFHVSVLGKIKAFAPVTTCFSLNRPVLPGHIYLFRLLEPVKAIVVDETEVRIDLEDAIGKIEIYYIGYSKPGNLWVIDKYGRSVWRNKEYKIIPEFAELGRLWNKEEKERIENIAKKRPDFYHIEKRK